MIRPASNAAHTAAELRYTVSVVGTSMTARTAVRAREQYAWMLGPSAGR